MNKMVIISHVIHFSWSGAYNAYGPYTREIDLWADIFPEIVIAAPVKNDNPPADCLAFGRPNITISPQPERGGKGAMAKIFQIFSLPWMVYRLSITMMQADAIQVRCPGNLGLLGVLLAPLFSRYRVAKYAGQWSGYPGEAWSYRLQRWLLRSKWWNAPVLVYGKLDHQPDHVIPFFTSVMGEEHVQLACQSAKNKKIHTPLRVLFVGRLSREKNVHVLVEALRLFVLAGKSFECRIVGTGPMQPELAKQLIDLGLNPADVLLGALPFEKVMDQYAWADVLVLASETEGWPKAIAEAMAFGVVCIGSQRGIVPQILGEGRGVLVEPGDAAMLANLLGQITANELEYDRMSLRAAEWAQKYSLEGLKEAIEKTLNQQWKLQDNPLGRSAV